MRHAHRCALGRATQKRGAQKKGAGRFVATGAVFAGCRICRLSDERSAYGIACAPSVAHQRPHEQIG
jgi:hypothetical protein